MKLFFAFYTSNYHTFRNLTFNEEKMKREKTPITEIHLNPLLDGLNMSQDEFTDLCILLGCDYCDKIRGKLGTIQILC